MIVPAKCVRSWFRAVRTIRPGWPASCKMSSTAQDIKMLRRQMDATTRFDTLMNAMMEQNKNISSQYLKLSAETSSRIDKFAGSQLIALGVVVTALGVVVTVVIAGVGYLDGKNTQLDRKIEAGNAQLKVEMKEMDRKIETGNAQLKEKMDRKIEAGNAQLKKDLLEALTGKGGGLGK